MTRGGHERGRRARRAEPGDPETVERRDGAGQKPERIPGGWRADRRTGSAVRKRGRVYDRYGEGTVIDRRIRPGYDHTVSAGEVVGCGRHGRHRRVGVGRERSEEHTSELQSRGHLVCRLLLEKKKTDTSIRCTHLVL